MYAVDNMAAAKVVMTSGRHGRPTDLPTGRRQLSSTCLSTDPGDRPSAAEARRVVARVTQQEAIQEADSVAASSWTGQCRWSPAPFCGR